MRVLLVEDDEMIGQSLKQALGAHGWSVDWVKDGLLAQSALADGDYACVLLDLGLPKRDGIEVLQKARSARRSHAGAGAHGPRQPGRPDHGAGPGG